MRCSNIVLTTLVAPALAASLGAVGCSSADPSTSPAEVSATAEPLLASCDEASVRAAAPADRRNIIDRGLHWVDEHVMYSQSAYYQGYRTDCSGFVSMCWGLNSSRVTWQFAPFDTAVSHDIGWNDLVPGDALNRTTPNHDEQHIMLFGGWLDSAHTRLCVIQENETGTPANVKAYGKSYFSLFQPIRYNGSSPPPPSGGGGGGGGGGDCSVHADGKLWCTNRQAAMYAEPRDSSSVTDHLKSTYSWFKCWGTGQLHAGGNTTWYYTYGDDNGAGGWVAAVNLDTQSSFDANPSAHGLPRCDSSGGGGGGGGDCSVHSDGKLWCTNRPATMYAQPNDSSAVTNHLKSTYSWFTCWGTGQLHAGGNTTWYYTYGDDNSSGGWVAAVNLNTPDSFDSDPSAHGLPKCGQ